MANSSTNLRTVAVGSSPYSVVNANNNAGSPSTLLGIDEVGTSGLTLSIFGGKVLVGGVLTTLANQTSIAMTSSSTNYVEFDPTDTGTTSGIKVNTTAFTAGRTPLYTVVTSGSAITSWTDYRTWGSPSNPRAVVNMASDANKTLTQAEASVDILEITSVSLGATRNIVLPLIPKMWVVFNNTTGSQSIQFIGATGTGITVANAKRAIIYSDGTNIVRVTADNP
jgi:hypothetical protein